MSSRMHIVLFDVDGTLLLSGGAGARALEEAFLALYDVPDSMRNVCPHGMTDRGICEELFLEHLGRKGKPEEYNLLLALYLECLERTVRESPDFHLLPGIPGVLERISRSGRVALGLGTGNVEKGARIKLERAGLNPLFSFGGFGGDSADRTELIEAGFRRGEALLRAEGNGAEVFRWVVGDTRRDVEAGRGCGARTVAVATGGDAYEELARSGADHLFADLSDEDALPALIAEA